VRDLIEIWVQEYPVANRQKIKGELRDDDKFHDAFFELFSYAILRKVGYEVEVEPKLRNGLTPDFGIYSPDGVLSYVEVTVSTGRADLEAGLEKLRHTVRDTINQIDSPRYFIGLRFMNVGPKALKRKIIINYVTKCLRKLEQQSSGSQVSTFFEGQFSQSQFCHDGWAIRLWFTSRNKPPDDSKSARSLGIETVWVGSNATPKQLMDKVKKKANKYKGVGVPFVVGVNAMSNLANQESVKEALYGKLPKSQPHALRGRSSFHKGHGEALFVSRKGFSHSTVSAVLGACRASHYRCGVSR
jgi:hypothetical protein